MAVVADSVAGAVAVRVAGPEVIAVVADRVAGAVAVSVAGPDVIAVVADNVAGAVAVSVAINGAVIEAGTVGGVTL